MATQYGSTDRRGQDRGTRAVCKVTVVFAMFMAHLFTSGISFSIGVYYLVFLEVFGQSSGVTSWVGSLNFASLCAAGPVASYLLTRVGCSATLMLGGLLSGLGLILTAFATSLHVVFFTFGVVTGVGFGLVYTTGVSLVTFQLDKWRKVGMAVSLTGIGLGTCLHPYLTRLLIESYGWRGAMVINGGLVFNTCVMALLVRLVTTIQEANPRQYISNTQEGEKEYDKQTGTENLNFNKNHGMFSIAYIVLHVNNFLYCFGQSATYTHLVAFALTKDVPLRISSSFISIVGVSTIVGRIVLGLVSQHKKINVTLLYSMCYIVAGLCSVGYSYSSNYVLMIVLLSILGFCFAAFGPLLSEIVYLYVRVDQFAHAYGYLLISDAVGTLIGAPCAGWLYDVTEHYEYSFYLGGIVLLLSGLVMAVPKCTIRKTPHDISF